MIEVNREPRHAPGRKLNFGNNREALDIFVNKYKNLFEPYCKSMVSNAHRNSEWVDDRVVILKGLWSWYIRFKCYAGDWEEICKAERLVQVRGGWRYLV